MIDDAHILGACTREQRASRTTLAYAYFHRLPIERRSLLAQLVPRANSSPKNLVRARTARRSAHFFRQRRDFRLGTSAAMAPCMSSPWLVSALGGAGLAIVSGVHCLTMCGPLAAASQARAGSGASARYLLGRVASYSVLGLLAGSVGQGLLATPWARWAEALLAWALTLVLLHSALGFFGLRRTSALLSIGKGPRRNWAGKMLVHAAHDPLLLGVATALLPCAALFSALLASAALGRGTHAAVLMASFALVTSPVLLGGAQLGRLARFGERGRRVLGLVLVAGALVTALRPLSSLRAESPASCPLHAEHGRAP
jgi:sulfite exporter TauE/SafE